MISKLVKLAMSRRVYMYEPFAKMNTRVGGYCDYEYSTFSSSTVIEPEEKMGSQPEDALHGVPTSSNMYNQELSNPTDKIQRRLAQNREAARKSRLRRKAYVQQLKLSRVKLIQLEQELECYRQPGSYVGGVIDHLPFSQTVNPGIAAFGMEYRRWVEEQDRLTCQIKSVLLDNNNASDEMHQMLVDRAMSHYLELFHLKSTAAKIDVFYLMSGTWTTSAEQFFLWIGGFRPSELLKVLVSNLEPLTDQQPMDICSLMQSCQQAEDALSQGMDKLQQTVAEAVAAGLLGEESYASDMTSAIEKLEAFLSFLDQADHLRRESLQQMHRILSTHQAARGFLALGEYFQRLRALSSLCASRSQDAA